MNGPAARYIANVRQIVRQSLLFFLAGTVAAVALRLWFVFRYPAITDDSLMYGDIASNWMQHGIFGISGGASGITPTLIRLPGYPAILVGSFAVFGIQNYRAVFLLQVLVDLATCFLIADLTRRMISPRAAKAAFLLAALCPFLANYTAAILTETWEIFFGVVAIECALLGLASMIRGRLGPWIGCGFAMMAAILLRPDAAILLTALELYLGVILLRSLRAGKTLVRPMHVLRSGFLVGAICIAPLIPWTLRNLRIMHDFQPLAPRYANDPDTYIPKGFYRWIRTWLADYVSVEEIVWVVPDAKIDLNNLPTRAFDSPAQRQQTAELFDEYNRSLKMTPALDEKFGQLAAERVHDSPLRYYFVLPAMRVTSQWLRPRVELLPCDSRWWEFNDDLSSSVLAVAMGLIGLFYIGAAVAGLIKGGISPPLGMLLTFVVVRSVFLSSMENPEPRYVLECYPVAILLAANLWREREPKAESPEPVTS